MNPRGTWQGMLTILRFNWPFYLCAAWVLIAAAAGMFQFAFVSAKLACAAVMLGSGYFLVVSLGVSHWIYDRSDLYRFQWLQRALSGQLPSRAIVCHAGFDEGTALLKEHYPVTHWQALDHFDEELMTEPSIRRARRLFPPSPASLAGRFDCWPVEPSSADVILGLLAIHELRSVEQRAAWFGEARRCLKPGGRIILAEHVRDLANFVAYGPGFVHFHSVACWQRSWELAGLRLTDAFRVTPWIRIFVIQSS